MMRLSAGTAILSFKLLLTGLAPLLPIGLSGLALVGDAGLREVSAAEPTEMVPVFSLFDRVGPYRKNGLFESYGANLRERRAGPISVTEAELEVTRNEAWVIWSPDHSPARDATHLTAEFAEMPKSGELTISLLAAEGDGQSFKIEFGSSAAAADAPHPAESFWPKGVFEAAAAAPAGAAMQATGLRFTGPLSSALLEKLHAGGPAGIKQIVLRLSGIKGSVLRIKSLGLTTARPAAERGLVEISGEVRGAALPPGTSIELIDEHGGRQAQTISLDNRFAFGELDPTAPVSLRIRHPQRLRHTTLGRWFQPGYARNDLAIEIRPEYLNLDGHLADPTKARFAHALSPTTVSALYEPHTRQYWPGHPSIQEFDSTTFTNNHGYVDRDRFFDNPDACVRFGSTGGSDMVSLQMPVADKFNILLEENLGIMIGRCVEVISAAVDNGDIGTNYPRIRDYTSKFKLDFTLVSMINALVSQVSPTMLRDGLGFDPENSALPNFLLDASGKLVFRPASPVYPVFMTKPTMPSYLPGIGFGDTLSVPFEDMPQPGREAFEYWERIVAYIDSHHPGQNLVFHTGVDQAQCRKNCKPEISLGARNVVVGAEGFVRNVRRYCAENKRICLHPAFSSLYGEQPSLLTFVNDGHYSWLGQQWLAEEMAPLLNRLLSKTPRQ